MFGLLKSNSWRLESMSCNRNELKQCINIRQITKMSNSTWQHADNSGYHADPWPIKLCHTTDDLTAQLFFIKFLVIIQHEVPFIHLLEGRVTVSNNFPKRRQNGFKIGTRDKLAIHSKWDSYLHKFFFTIGDFLRKFSLYTSCGMHNVFWAWEACEWSEKKGWKTDRRTKTEQRTANVQMSRAVEVM